MTSIQRDESDPSGDGCKNAKEQGFPARSKIPFGLRKVRNENGRFVAIELDPVTAPLARQRIDWYLSGLSLSEVPAADPGQTEYPVSVRHISSMAASPSHAVVTAGVAKKNGDFSGGRYEPAFKGLITDAEHDAIKVKLAAGNMHQGLRGRETRMFSSLVRCKDCGSILAYKTFPKANVIYLRCSNIRCDKRSKGINIDQVFGVLQYAVTMHAEALVPVLAPAQSDPPEVLKLREQISVLETVPGTEALIEQKRLEIKRLSAADTELPAWLTIAAVRSLLFWLQDEPKLNSVLRTMLESITVDLRRQGEGLQWWNRCGSGLHQRRPHCRKTSATSFCEQSCLMRFCRSSTQQGWLRRWRCWASPRSAGL